MQCVCVRVCMCAFVVRVCVRMCVCREATRKHIYTMRLHTYWRALRLIKNPGAGVVPQVGVRPLQAVWLPSPPARLQGACVAC